MEYVLESWSLGVILFSAFLIGWTAEAAQTFIPRALALSLLAWLQTLPEFAVEATVAWHQQRDLMIANLTGSLRLLVGLGWPMIFFVHSFSQRARKGRFIREIKLDDEDCLSVFFLFVSVVYFLIVLAKGSLNCYDSGVLIVIYCAYLYLAARLPAHDAEVEEDLPWVAKKVVGLPKPWRLWAVLSLFLVGGWLLYVSAHPFISTLQRWSLGLGMSTFVFIQWVAPFLSEFPEKVSAFNWARQETKAPMAVMNMVSSNINQWTMLAAMIPIVFNLSLGHWEPVMFDSFHQTELSLTIAQSFLGGLLLLDLRFSLLDATVIFVLWLVQFLYAPLRVEVAVIYSVWCAVEVVKAGWLYFRRGQLPRALKLLPRVLRQGAMGV